MPRCLRSIALGIVGLATLICIAAEPPTPPAHLRCDGAVKGESTNQVHSELLNQRVPEIDLDTLPAKKLPEEFLVENPYFKLVFGDFHSEHFFHAPALWKKTKQALLAHAAMMDGLFDQNPKFYLGRDGNWQFYASKLLNPTGKHRLIYVSRSIIEQCAKNISQETLLKRYLLQEGLENEAVLFDTGFRGTIISKIQKLLPEFHLYGFLHLANSDAPFPSSRVFLATIDSPAGDAPQGLLGGYQFAVTFETLLPKFRYKITELLEDSAGIFPSSVEPTGDLDDAPEAINPELAIKMVQDLKYELSLPGSQKHYREDRAYWRELKKLYYTDRKSFQIALNMMKRSVAPWARAVGFSFPEIAAKLSFSP